MQPTPFCNISCSYCYLPNRTSKSTIGRQTLNNLFSKVFASGWTAGSLQIVWHAGEPMMLPVTFYREALELIERLRPSQLVVMHGLQTNGTLIDDEWCRFLQEARIDVGVSIDGPKAIHDARRRTRAGQGTFDRTMAGIATLQKHHIPFHTISVLGAAALADPEAMFQFFTDAGISEVCFNIEESEPSHVSETLNRPDVEMDFRRFLERFWRMAVDNPGTVRFIREIDAALNAIVRPLGTAYANQLVEPFAVMTVDVAGNVSTFSPELLGNKNSQYGDYILGNVNDTDLECMRRSATLAAMSRDIAAGVEKCRRDCDYFAVCGGGEPGNKIAENGSFDSAETRYCKVIRRQPVDIVLAAIETIAAGDKSWQSAPARAS